MPTLRSLNYRLPLLAAALAPALAPAAAGQGNAAGGGRLYWLPTPSDAGPALELVERHIESGDWDRGVDAAQRLVVGPPGDLLPEEVAEPGAIRFESPHHLGVAETAREYLRRLPRTGIEAYERRFGPEAERALERALEDGTPHALLRVAAQFPVAQAAERALWSAGDVQFERGQVGDAQHAWTRAADLGQRLGNPVAKASLARRLKAAEAIGDQLGPPAASHRTPGPSEARGPIPTEISESWLVDLPSNPFSSRRSPGQPNFFPVLHGDRLYLSTTLEVLALDSYTGEELWRSAQPDGWELVTATQRSELEQALDRESQLIAPAVDAGVVVSALQVPYARLPSDNYQGFTITVPLPDRRLFAFDADTGAVLWSHEPPPAWDGNSGTYTERMSVAGSPTIAGGRVIVPMFRMDGRVDFQVAAFELATGELIWSTPLISGQRELNMFNRHEREFSAPPVRVEGDSVLVLSQLGTVASVDLLTGSVRWQAVYEQLPLPKSQSLIPSDRTVRWKNSAPVVAGDVVLATPLDSEMLVAFGLEDGRVLWSETYDALRPLTSRGQGDVDVLLGAGDDEVVLGGHFIVSWRKPGGLGSRRTQLAMGSLRVDLGPDAPRSWREGRNSPRATLGADRVLVPARTALLSLDRGRPGALLEELSDWDSSEYGNVVIGPGALYVTSNETLRGMLDLTVLEQRAGTAAVQGE
ncbi:MAG: PQQ-binding-like beta-propeller repeat protein, partial [Planctomycetota bacterium]